MEHLEVVSTLSVTQAGTLTSGSPVVTGLSTPALAGALEVTGSYFTDANGDTRRAFVRSIDSATQVTLDVNATETGPVALTFGLSPLTLREALEHERLTVLDDDEQVADWIMSALQVAQTLLRRTLIQTTYDWFLDAFPASANGYFNRLVRQMGPSPQWLPNGAAILYVPNPPLVSVASVKYYDSTGALTTVDPATYFVSTGNGSRIQPIVGHVWPVVRPQIDGVVVRYTAGPAGPAPVTPNVKSALKLMVDDWYEHRGRNGDAQVYPVPFAVESLLAPSDHGNYS